MRDRSKDAAIITTQFRSKRAMVYELKCESVKLSISIIARENSADEGEWRVEVSARPESETEPVLIGEWGATREGALRAVARTWNAREPRPLPAVSWDAVVQALTVVRAL
jgi:hypothetical protein